MSILLLVILGIVVLVLLTSGVAIWGLGRAGGSGVGGTAWLAVCVVSLLVGGLLVGGLFVYRVRKSSLNQDSEVALRAAQFNQAATAIELPGLPVAVPRTAGQVPRERELAETSPETAGSTFRALGTGSGSAAHDPMAATTDGQAATGGRAARPAWITASAAELTGAQQVRLGEVEAADRQGCEGLLEQEILVAINKRILQQADRSRLPSHLEHRIAAEDIDRRRIAGEIYIEPIDERGSVVGYRGWALVQFTPEFLQGVQRRLRSVQNRERLAGVAAIASGVTLALGLSFGYLLVWSRFASRYVWSGLAGMTLIWGLTWVVRGMWLDPLRTFVQSL